MNKYIGLNSMGMIIAKLNEKFAQRKHIHGVSEIDGLQDQLDMLIPQPDIETSEDVIIRINQLTHTVNSMSGIIDDLNNTINALIPAIGEIYITTSNEDPSVKFPGTVWEQIKDTFLLASGDLYTLGSIGGESEHTLTIDEIPSHSHSYKRHEFDRNDTDPDTGEDVYGANNKTLGARMGVTEFTGGGQPHNNMPPYLAVSIWKRVA